MGKTALIQRYFHESFDKQLPSTMACDYKIRNIKLKWEDEQHKAEEDDDQPQLNLAPLSRTQPDEDVTKIRLYVWDTAGQERFRHITRNYYNNS